MASEVEQSGPVEASSEPETKMDQAPKEQLETPNVEAESPQTSAPISPRPSFQRHRRRASIALSTSSVDGTEIKSAMVIIKSALEIIKGSKDAKRMPVLSQAINKVLTQLEESPDALPAPAVILEPLRIVCAQGSSTEMRVVALDTIGKLFTFGYLEDEPPEIRPEDGDVTPAPYVPLINRAVDIVCDTFDGESTDSRVELQIIKALTAAIVNDDVMPHGSTLLKAVRQIYNIFVVSRFGPNQTIAQVSLTQTVQVVFDRVKTLATSEANSSTEHESHSKRTASVSSTVSSSKPTLTLEQMKNVAVEEEPSELEDADLVTHDAFLLFRTLCKLSEKTDIAVNDLKSHGMRSKLLSLHLLHLTLKQHISVFASKTLSVSFRSRGVRFVEAIKNYLWSSLSRNAASISPPIYEITAEIFWILLSNLRSDFKREIQVFFKEVYFTIVEMHTSTIHQKLFFLGVIFRLCNDPRALVELYLNYDCDANSTNIFELLINILVKFAISVIPMTQQAMQVYQSERTHLVSVYNLNQPPSVAIAHVVATGGKIENVQYPREYSMKMIALESLISVLRSLHMWYQREGQSSAEVRSVSDSKDGSASESRTDVDTITGDDSQSDVRESINGKDSVTDEPSQFESVKTSKKALTRAIAEFNYKPERGIKLLVSLGVIKAKEAAQLADVFLTTRGFDLTKLGEYLGKDDAFNRSVMHHFVDKMDFKNTSFIDALRHLLQQFRLPGEGQVVDRYMLEFANKYTHDNPTVFSTAETPYVLGYSVMMLNTDLHSVRLKSTRMSLDDFIANNRGINDGLDLPDNYLGEIYDEIAKNEIKLVSEHEDATIKGGPPTQERSGWLGGSGADTTEAYIVASEVIAAKTAKLFKSFMAKDKKPSSVYYNASHVEHVQPMFEDIWMSVLAGLSGPFQHTDDREIIQLCIEGLSLATRIACHFDIELARISYVQTLTKFANLGNVKQLKVKNIETAQALLRVAFLEGNNLAGSWYDVIIMVSQLERVQLIANGVAAGSLPNLNGVKDRNTKNQSYQFFDSEAAEALFSREIVVSSDKIFTQSANLVGNAIVDFVKALSAVSIQEIESSQDSKEPRLFCLQKMVDVCYYNMARIRMEWSQIWAIMGDLFNKVGANPNEHVLLFGLDSLRQLSVRFLDLDELTHFQFQKEFLKPFNFTMEHNSAESAKTLVIDSLTQMVLQKSSQLRSGWLTIFSTLSAASKFKGRVAARAFELVSTIAKKYQDVIFKQDEGVIDAYLKCLASMAKQTDIKIALHSVEYLHAVYKYSDDLNLWHLVSNQVHDVIMFGLDLEVRGRALEYQFEVLMDFGSRFSVEEWDSICRDQLFPLFYVLESSKDKMTDELNVWMSTTLVQALRNIVALFHRYFEKLEHALNDFFLDLLKTCICQENKTVSRIGSSCLVQLVSENADRFADSHWRLIAAKIEFIFIHLTANELTDESLNSEGHKAVAIRSAIQKSVQQPLIIEMVDDLFKNDNVFELMPIPDTTRIIDRVLKSYGFARKFNYDQDLRARLQALGFMREVPNLGHQETMAAMTYLTVSFRLFNARERFTGYPDAREEISNELIPMCVTVIRDYNNLKPQDHRQVKALLPVVVNVLRQVRDMDASDFKDMAEQVYMEVIEILNKDMPGDLREAVQSVLRRVAEVHMVQNGKSNK